MERSLNKYHYSLILLTLLMTMIIRDQASAQVFPEVNDPVRQKINERQEKEKLGSFYYNDKQYEKAAEIYKELFDQNPTHFYYTYYFYCLVNLEEYDEAEKAAKRMTKTTKRPVRYEVDQGYIFQLQDKYDRAERTYDDILNSIKPNKSDVLETANAFVSRQLFDYAIAAYKRGREILPGTESFHEELARIYEITGNYEQMITEYLDLLQEEPNRIEFVQGRLQNTLKKDSEDTISEILRQSLLKKAQDNPDDRNFSEMLMWLSIQRKDFVFALVQAKSLDKRYGENGQQVFALGSLALSNENYEAAADAFQYVIDKGPENPYYLESITGNLKARFFKIVTGLTTDKHEYSDLEQEYKATLDLFGYNPRTIFLMRDVAHLQAFYLDKMDQAVEILDQAVSMAGVNPNVNAECKLELGDILLYRGDVWDASLLYSQVDKALKNEPIGSEAKLRNARLSYFIGEFEWARAQLDVLKAATSKLIANDALELSLLISDNMDLDSSFTSLHYYARADLLSYMNRYDEALATLDTIQTLNLYHSLDDEVLFKKASIYIKLQQYALADSLLDKVITTYPFDILADNALFKRAEIQEVIFGNKELAMDLYRQILTDYSGSLFVTEARKRFRSLRGDEPPDGNTEDNKTPLP